jgi:hypothetical protein
MAKMHIILLFYFIYFLKKLKITCDRTIALNENGRPRYEIPELEIPVDPLFLGWVLVTSCPMSWAL